MPTPPDLQARIHDLEVENLRLRNELDSQSASQTQLLERNRKLQTILDHMPAMIGYWDKDLHNRFGNRAYLDWFGILPERMPGMHIRDLLGEERYRLNLPYMEGALRGELQRFERDIPTPDGKSVRHSLAEYIPDVVDGKVLGFFVQVSDVTALKEAEKVIEHLAFFDPLTDLPNRRLFNDRMNLAMASSKRSGSYCAVMFLDLDNFKSLNDAHGHELGDALLIQAATRLKSCVREIDTIARFGGDEFVVLLSELGINRAESLSQAQAIAEKIRDTLSKPYLLTCKAGRSAQHLCSTSIGVVLFSGQSELPDDILKWADSSMYQAKRLGGNTFIFHQPESLSLPKNTSGSN